MGEHEGHAEKGHPIGAVIMVLIIVGLMVYFLGFADSIAASLLTVPFTLGIGLYAVFGLGRDRSDEH